MGNTSRSTMVFDAEAARAVSELQKLGAAQRQLKKELREATDQSVRGNSAAEKSLDSLARQYVVNKQRIDQLNQSQRQQVQGQTGVARSTRSMNATILEASRGVDDFITVLQMPGMGLIPALRASSNNFSVLLGRINPLLSVVPSLATFALGLAVNMGKTAENTDKANTSLQRHLEVTRAINDEARRARGEDDALEEEAAERRFQDEIAALQAEQHEKRKFLAEQGGGLHRLIPATPFSRSGAQQQRDEIQQAQNDLAVLQNREKELRRVEEERRKAVEEEKRQKKEEKIKERVRERLDEMPTSEIAQQGLREGKTKEQVTEEITRGIGGSFDEEGRPFVREQVAGVVDDAERDLVSDRFKETNKKQPTEMERRKKAIDAQMADLRAREAAALADSRRGKLDRRQQRAFDAEERQLKAEQTEIDAQLKKQAVDNESTAKNTQTMTEQLDTLISLMSNNQPAPRGRQVARNG